MQALSDQNNVSGSFEKECRDYGNRLRDLCRATPYIWAGARSFVDTCDIMILYFAGIIPSAPCYTGPMKRKKLLKACCRNGLLIIQNEAEIQFLLELGFESAIREAILRFDAEAVLEISQDYLSTYTGVSQSDTRVTVVSVKSKKDMLEELVEISALCIE